MENAINNNTSQYVETKENEMNHNTTNIQRLDNGIQLVLIQSLKYMHTGLNIQDYNANIIY